MRLNSQIPVSDPRSCVLDGERGKSTSSFIVGTRTFAQDRRKIKFGTGGTKGLARAKQHTFNNDEREAAEKLGELFGTDWPEIAEKKLISVPNLSQKQEGLPDGTEEVFVNQ